MYTIKLRNIKALLRKFPQSTTLIILLIISLVVIFFPSQSPEQKLQEVIREYNESRDMISMRAESRKSMEQSEVDKLEASVILIQSRIKVLNKCISENTKNQNTIVPPIDCSDIELSKQEELGWRLNKNWLAQEYIQLTWETYKDRAIQLLNQHKLVAWSWDTWERLGREYNVDPILAISIARADSKLWDMLKTKNNIGNVWNNDRGDTVAYKDIDSGIEAIFKVLNNKYLWGIYTVGYLSCGGKYAIGITDCFQNGEKVYATSEENWNNNVLNTMSMIYWKQIDEDYKFRF